jgi:SAM-dependent methyltransferase
MKANLVDTLSGFYATRAIDTLFTTGVLAELIAGRSLSDACAERKIDRLLAYYLVRYVILTTDLLVSQDDGEHCALGEGYEPNDVAHLIDLYAGAFGPCADRLPAMCLDPTSGASHVDTKRHAAAFGTRAGDVGPYLPSIIEELEIGFLLDLGCGGGAMLRQLASANEVFHGIGVDVNPEVIAFAGASLPAACQGRISFKVGDLMELASILDPQEIANVQAVSFRSVANGFFGWDEQRNFSALLDVLKSLFPARLLFIADYLPQLNAEDADAEPSHRTLIHDFAQVASSQGLPPPSHEKWFEVYRKHDLNVIGFYGYGDEHIKHFIHILRL